MKPLDRVNGYAHVAVRYGLEESIFLDSLMYWYRANRANQRNFQDGRWWTFNSASAFAELFPWWSAKQIRRIIASCKEQGALLSGNYNEDKRDRTLWYTPSDELLKLYNYAEEGESTFPDGKMSVDQMGKCNIEHVNTHVNTKKPITLCGNDPDWTLFDRFWAAYPKKKNKDAARKAWRKLNPDLELCRVMAAALERDKQSREWLKENGDFIPHPSTWLNGRRWEDEHNEAPGGGEAPAPVRPEGGRYI